MPKKLPAWTGADQDEEPDRPPVARDIRRKREPATSQQPGYYEGGPAGDKKCGALKGDGSRCTLAAGWGTDHVGYGPCKHHMGATPAGQKAAANEMAGELMQFYGSPIETSPIDALLQEVSRTAGHIAWLHKRIGMFEVPLHLDELDPDTKISRKVIAGLPPEIEGWLRMYQSERAQLVRVSKAALDAGVNERLVQIAEHQGAKIADAIEVILAALELTAAQQARVPIVVPSVLRQLTSGVAIEGVTVDQEV